MRKIAFITLLTLITACNHDSRDADMAEVKKLNHDFWKNDSIKVTPERAYKLDSAYKGFINDHPNDTAVPAILYNDAKLHLSVLNNPDQAAVTLSDLYNRFPKHRLAPAAVFEQAFIYDEILKNYQLAGKAYQKLIDDYPESEYAPQAKILIQNLGKDPGLLLEHKIEDNAKNSMNSNVIPKPH